MELAQVLEKIQALQALAENNTNEHEMAAALSAAEKLTTLYRVNQSSIQSLGGEQDPFVEVEISREGRRVVWRETIVDALCQHYGAAMSLTSGRGECSYRIVARQADAEIIVAMYGSITYQIDRLGRFHCWGKGPGKGGAWREGAAKGVAEKLHEIRIAKQATATGMAKESLERLSHRAVEAHAEMLRRDPSLRLTRGPGGARAQETMEEGRSVAHRKVELGQGNPAPSLPVASSTLRLLK